MIKKIPFTFMLLLAVLITSCYNAAIAAAIKINKNTAFEKKLKRAGPPADTITIVNGSLAIMLDTVKDNIVNQLPVTIKFKMNYEVKKKVRVAVNIDPLQAMQNISLYKDYTDTVTFDATDWGAKGNDSTISKTIKLSVLQTKLVTAEQTVVLKLKNGKTNFIVRLLPFVTKSKAGTLHLVESGNAQIESGKVGISHYYGATLNAMDSINIRVRVYGEYKDGNNQLVFDFLDTNVSKHFKIMENPVTINRREWDSVQTRGGARTEKTGVLNIPLHLRTINLNDSLNNTPYIDLILKGQSQAYRGSQKIRLSVKDKPFWAEVGTNFDLLDKIKTNNFYAGVYMFDKDVARIGGKKGDNNLSFTGGVYESQSVSARSTSAAGIAYRDLNNVRRDTGALSASTSVKSIGLLFSPHLKLTNGKTDVNGLHIFASFYTELLWQTVSTGFDYSKLGKKDSVIAVAKLPMPIGSYPYKENSVNYDFRSHYFGFGIPIYIKETQFNLYINTVFGISNQRFYVNAYKTDIAENNEPLNHNYVTDLTFLNPKSNWNGFYLVQYRLNEVAYGITFSGEVRGLLLRGAKPVVTLAFSKKFDLSALLKPLVAPF